MADKEVTKRFLRDINDFIDKGYYDDATSLLRGSNFVEPKQDWNLEVENLHSNPIDGEEEILAKKLDVALLEIAEHLAEDIKVGDPVTYMRLVLCLNKLGRNSPKRLVEKVWKIGHDCLDRNVGPGASGEIFRLMSFLPIV
ncbi:MAG TPA: hypothetical protein PLI45_04175 [Candidatus Woesebacteria bacterium]|nr:hypothetical protein [Candidatus Woesebacteria bacterium]